MISLVFYESVTDGPTDGRTDRRTDGPTDIPGYRDARTHLKTKRSSGIFGIAEVKRAEVTQVRVGCWDL